MQSLELLKKDVQIGNKILQFYILSYT